MNNNSEASMIHKLSDADIDKLADRVAIRLEERFYREVGRSVVKRALVIIGIAVVSLAGYLHFR